jgi:coenzyme Q-binding protein COQ10
LIQAEASSDALFSHLITIWQLLPHESSTHCYIDFRLEFEFSSIIYSNLANAWFDQVSVLVIDAFEKRCNELYGPPAPPIE